MPANLENSAVATGLERSVFIPIPKKGSTKECSNYRTIAHVSHASRVMLKILQGRLQQYVNRELLDVQAGFRKGRGTRNQIANICWIIEKLESSRKISISAFLTMPKPLTVWITRNYGKFLKEVGLPDHLTCFPRNLYAYQEATVRNRHGITDWFQLGKEYVKAVYCHPAYLTPVQSTLCTPDRWT